MSRSGRPHARGALAGVAALALAGLIAALAFAAVSIAAPSASEKKRQVDEALAESQRDLQETREKEQVLSSEVAAYGQRIRAVERRLAPLQSRLSTLEAEVARLQARLEQLTADLLVQRRRLQEAQDQLAQRRLLLARRLREIYTRGEPDPFVVMLQSTSLSDAAVAADLLQRAADQDQRTVEAVREFAVEVRETRDRIAKAKAEVEVSEARASEAAAEVRVTTDELRREKEGLAKLVGQRRSLLSKVTVDRKELEEHTSSLAEESANLAAKIVGAQAAGPAATAGSAPSSAGFIWPVSGLLTSTFGPRWGRMHEGIDISVGSGTSVAAAAGGTVILAGWNGGYGNLVVIDHGGGLSTAYAHNSSISVAVGQVVGQGQTIAASGSTGHSTGPHVHFEVRVNGAAVDPLGYL